MKKRYNRRDFLKRGFSGMAGITLLSPFAGKENRAEKETQTESQRKIVSRMLGRTGIRIPIVSMGILYDIGLGESGY